MFWRQNIVPSSRLRISFLTVPVSPLRGNEFCMYSQLIVERVGMISVSPSPLSLSPMHFEAALVMLSACAAMGFLSPAAPARPAFPTRREL